MNHRTRTGLRLFLGAALAGAMTAGAMGCGDGTDTGPVSSHVLAVDPDAGPGLFLDAVRVDSAWVDGATLRLRVTYSGGCKDHSFRLVGADAFSLIDVIPGPYPQAFLSVYLIHDAHGDACRSLFTRTLVFDVSPASRLHREQLGGDGLFAFLVNSLTAPDSVSVRSVLFHSGAADSPREDVEAEQIAAFLTGDLLAGEDLYGEVKGDLASIREQYGDTVTGSGRPLGDVTFRLPWTERALVITFETAYADSVASGNYGYWDQLNGAFGLTGFEILSAFGSFTVRLRFEPELDMCAVAAFYANLPGVAYPPHPDWLGGDWPGIYPRVTDGGISYLIREAWGDCPSGCPNSDYWYFEADSAGVVFRGHYDPQKDPFPDWWTEAQLNVDFYDTRCAVR